MTEKQQIEEMAKVMCGNDCEECAKESANFYGQTIEQARNNKCLIKNCAKQLHNQGYRKIPQDAVVYTKQEWEQLVESQTAHKLAYATVQVKKAQKEILQSIYKQFVAYTLGGEPYTDTEIYETIQFLEEKYGVKIEL